MEKKKIILPLKLLILLSEMHKFLQPANLWYDFICRKKKLLLAIT